MVPLKAMVAEGANSSPRSSRRQVSGLYLQWIQAGKEPCTSACRKVEECLTSAVAWRRSEAPV